MNWNGLQHNRILRGILCLLLIMAIGLSLILPGVDLHPSEPEDPLEDGSIREITVLKVGENISQLNTIVVPSGGSAAPTEPRETSPDETNPEETKPRETVPEETQSDQPDIDDGEEGNEEGNQGEEGGKELNLDLALVMTWYKYGTEPKTLVCAPDKAVSRTLNTAQLADNQLEYDFRFKGADSEFVEITSVSVAEGDTAYKTVREEGSIPIQLPGGTGQRHYTFRVNALAEKKNDEGQTVSQEITFVYVMKCSYFMDLQLELRWNPTGEGERIISCDPDKAEAFSVHSYELHERVFSYSTLLTGSLAEDAEITGASYITASGQESGPLETNNGTLVLYPAPGKSSETYYLTFTVKTPEREVLYTYNLVYQEQLDVQLSFTWVDRGLVDHNLICRPEGSVSERIKNNQLSAGAVPYEMELTGTDAAQGKIVSISCASEASGGFELEESGSLPMAMPDGSTSNTYRITVSAMVMGQRMTFTIVLYYANDVTLQMEYFVKENGSHTQRFLTCENTKSRQAEAVYDDQLESGMLLYTMSIAGSDADSVRITSVTCYQSGTGSTVSLGASDEIKLLLESGKTGENTFRVQAQDDAGNWYQFTVSIPYKHRGTNSIEIRTNLQDGQVIPNESKTNLTVTAWSKDENGNVLAYIPANGVDTKLTVKLDGVEIPYTSTSGASSEYDLIPENPEIGDTNTHILHIYAEDAYGEYGELELTLTGQRQEAGQKTGTASIYVDMTVLGLGVTGPVKYTVLADEPISYVIAKAVLGENTGEPFGAAEDTFGWSGSYGGTLDDGFYLQSITTGHSADALEGSSWPGSTEEEILQAIDNRFGKGSGLATIWRCLYRNGLNKSSGSGNSFGEFDYTSGSGWMYSVGGSTYYPGQSMSSIYLQDGDVLTLRYTLAYGWDVGGGSPGYGSTIGYCASAVNGSISIHHKMEQREMNDGSVVYVCHCCGLVQDCAHAHLTCLDLEDGTHISFCEDCRSSLGDPEDHIWVQTADDEEYHTCSACSAQESHRWREQENSSTATCTQPGIKTVRCTACNMVMEAEAAPRGHTLDNRWNHTGQEHYQKCSTCGETAKESVGTHQYVYYPEDDWYCRVCDAGHDWDYCGNDGLTVKSTTCRRIVYHCSDCGLDFVQDGEFEEHHSYAAGKCQYCGGEDPDYIPEETDPTEHVHSWTDGDILTEPGCETEGLQEIACTCGETGEKTLPPAGHSWDDGMVVSDPTCTESGACVYLCDVCGADKLETIPAAGHIWSEWETTLEPDVGIPGEQARCCEECGAEETKVLDPMPEALESGQIAYAFFSTAFWNSLTRILSA